MCGGENLISSLDIERVVPPELGAKYLAELFFTQPDLFDFFPPDEIHKIKPEYLIGTDFKRLVWYDGCFEIYPHAKIMFLFWALLTKKRRTKKGK